MWVFLKLLYEELDLFEIKGYLFIDYKGEEFISKCVFFMCMCDFFVRVFVYNCN